MGCHGVIPGLLFLGCAIMLSLSTTSAQQVRKITPGGTRYLIYTPNDYSATTPSPLLVVLHGQGSVGDNLDMLEHRSRDELPSKLIAQKRWPGHYPFVVVTPQLKRDESIPNPRDQSWPPGLIDELIEIVKRDYTIDTTRIYVTGLSKGARGGYDYAATYPHKVAALVPIAGALDSTRACQVKDIPLWIFHGTDDDVVAPVYMSAAARNISACSPKGKYTPRTTILYAQRHEGWNQIYNGSSGFDIYRWMMSFKKGDNVNVPPYVNAGEDINTVMGSRICLYADCFDSDGKVTDIRWSQVSGQAIGMKPSSGLLKVTPSSAGTYEFEIEVTDDDGARSRDRVKLIVTEKAQPPGITGIFLRNGKTQKPIRQLRDGDVIHPDSIPGISINLEATVSNDAASVSFRVNSFHNATTTSASPYLIANPRWTMEESDYLICATGYSGKEASGSKGASYCLTFTFSSRLSEPDPPVDDPPVDEPGEEPPVDNPEEQPPVEEPAREDPPQVPPTEEPPIQPPPGKNPVVVFPNPAEGTLQVYRSSITPPPLYLVITNVTGLEVFNATLGEESTALDISSLSPGFYIIRISTTNQVLSQERLVIH